MIEKFTEEESAQIKKELKEREFIYIGSEGSTWDGCYPEFDH